MRQQQLSVCEGDLQKDKQQVVSLWRESLHHVDPDRSFDWLFVDNPVASGMVYLLKVEDLEHQEEGLKTIGVIGTSPRKWKVNGQPIKASLFSDFVVAPAYRSLGPALKLVKQSVGTMKDDGISIFGFPNKKATAVLRRAGFTIIGDFARYGKVLRTREKLAGRMSPVLAALLAPFANLAVWLDDFLGYLQQNRSTTGKASWQRGFDDRFDELAENSSMGEIVNHRSREFLEWRFLQGPVTSYEVYTVTLSGDESRLAGYAVCRFADGIAFIEDFYARDGAGTARAVFASLMLALRSKKVNAASIEVMAPPDFMDFLGRMRFQKREVRQLFISTPNEELNAQAGKADRFYLTSSDEDQ